MIVTATSTGLESVVKAAKVKYQRSFKGLKQGIKECVELVLQESRLIVPIDKKILYDSSRAYVTGRGFDTVEGVVDYNTEYALRQHEDLSYRHAPGKSAKYLEIPMRRNRQRMAAIIKQRSSK